MTEKTRAPDLRVVDGGKAPVDHGHMGIDELFVRYSRYVAFIAHRIIGDSGDVEDLVQDVFLDAHKGLKRRENEAEIKGWLAVVTTRRARRHLKRRSLLRVVGLQETPSQRELTDKEATPEQTAIARSVYRQLDKLPVDDRIAWTLRHVQGETLDDCARLAGCSRATAHRRITSASIALKELFDNE